MKKIKSIKIIDAGSPCDIDTDFHTLGRKEVIQYVIDKYGKENVASLITKGMFKSKNAWKSMCKTYGVPFEEANRISKLFPDKFKYDDEFEFSDDDDTEDDAELSIVGKEITKELYPVYESAKELLGRQRETGVHACGVVISKENLSDTIPMIVRQNDNMPVTGFTYQECESLGLLKMDFLGLDTLDIIQQTVKNIKYTKGIDVDIFSLLERELDDKKTFELFQKGETVGVFQFGRDFVRDILRQVKPTSIDHLSAITALCRPGPMGMNAHTEFINRVNGTSELIPVDKSFYGTKVEEILKPSASLLVFQEQIMKIAMECAKFTAKEADNLRKAIGKKKMDLMLSLGDKFKQGMIENGYNPEAVDILWDGIIGFGEYSFNKCLDENTEIILEDYSKCTIKQLCQKNNSHSDLKILSLYPDGSIRPHSVNRVVKSGKKDCYLINTLSNETIVVSAEHRLLTNTGYKSIKTGLSINDSLALPNFAILPQINYNNPIRDNIYNFEKADESMIQYKNLKYTVVTEIKYMGLRNTYDIEMDLSGPSNFIANGLVSHNSHSYSYSLNSYLSAYLKAHYPVEWISAVLRQRIDDNKKRHEMMNECRRMKIPFIAPNINLSFTTIAPSKDAKSVLFGLSGIKGIGTELAKQIIEERSQRGLFKDMDDFVSRTHTFVKEKTLEILTLAGCFDCFNVSRKSIVENIKKLIKNNSAKPANTNLLFDIEIKTVLSNEEYPYLYKIKKEIEKLGTSLSGTLLDNLDVSKPSLEEISEGTYIAYFSEITKKNKNNRFSYMVTVDNGISTKDFWFSKNLQENIKEEPEENVLYKITFKRSWNNSYNIDEFQRLNTTEDGRMLYIIKGKKEFQQEITAKILENTGKDTIRVTFEDGSYIDIKDVEFMKGTTFYDIRDWT